MNYPVSKFVWKFCCPPLCCIPCPAILTAKLAFHPPEPTYVLIPNKRSKLSLLRLEAAGWPLSETALCNIEVFHTHTSRGNRIACMFVKGPDNPQCTILYSHGNATDLGETCPLALALSVKTKCNVLCYDYSGYGASTGKPSEKNIYADIEAAWDVLRYRYDFGLDKTILYGFSIGSVPTIDLAAKHKFRAVVIHSGMLSALRILCPSIKRTVCCDSLRNIEKVAKIQSPTLVIHGTEDEIVDFSHGLDIYERCPCAVRPLWIEGAGHNNVEGYQKYYTRLFKFVQEGT